MEYNRYPGPWYVHEDRAPWSDLEAHTAVEEWVGKQGWETGGNGFSPDEVYLIVTAFSPAWLAAHDRHTAHLIIQAEGLGGEFRAEACMRTEEHWAEELALKNAAAKALGYLTHFTRVDCEASDRSAQSRGFANAAEEDRAREARWAAEAANDPYVLREQEAVDNGYADYEDMMDDLRKVYDFGIRDYCYPGGGGWDQFWTLIDDPRERRRVRGLVEKYVGRPRITGPGGPGVRINGYSVGGAGMPPEPVASDKPGFLANTAAALGRLVFGYQASKRLRNRD